MRSLVVLSVLRLLRVESLLPPLTRGRMLARLVVERASEWASAWYIARMRREVKTARTRHGTSFITTLYSHRLILSMSSGPSQEVWGKRMIEDISLIFLPGKGGVAQTSFPWHWPCCKHTRFPVMTRC